MLAGHATEVCGIMHEQTLGTGRGDEPLVRTSAALFGWNGEFINQPINQSINHACLLQHPCVKFAFSVCDLKICASDQV